MISILGILQIVVSVTIFQGLIAEYFEKHLGEKALSIARTVSRMDQVRDALSGEGSKDIQKLALKIQKDANAEFVVVGDRNGIRLTHPNPDNIGEKFVGGDFQQVIKTGKAYISKSIGTLGPSLRGFAPVVDDNGKVIGFVSVGILESKILKNIKVAQSRPVTYVFMIIFMGIVGASIIAAYVKKLTLGLEPAEIAALHKERSIILNSVKEGILAVDMQGKVRFANKESERLLGAVDSVVGDHVNDLIPQAMIMERINEEEHVFDEEIRIEDAPMIFNMTPVIIKDKKLGLVASFRRKDEMDYLNKELSRAKECSELMRVQSHEYSNKLHTISGLIQIGEFDEAKDLILKESEEFHSLMAYLDSNVKCTVVGGMIIGKYNRAKELKCAFEVEAEKGWKNEVSSPEQVVTVVSNLIENGFDAALDMKERPPAVRVSFAEDKKNFICIVEDSGAGIENPDEIFTKGYTTKADGRGIGLYNLTRALEKLKGSIKFGTSSLGGAKFKVMIPKEGA